MRQLSLLVSACVFSSLLRPQGSHERVGDQVASQHRQRDRNPRKHR